MVSDAIAATHQNSIIMAYPDRSSRRACLYIALTHRASALLFLFASSLCADIFSSNMQHAVPDKHHYSSALSKFRTFCCSPENLFFCIIRYLSHNLDNQVISAITNDRETNKVLKCNIHSRHPFFNNWGQEVLPQTGGSLP